MSKDTPECAKLHHIKEIFFAGTCCLSNVFQDQETTISLKMFPRSLNMDLRPCPRVSYALDISNAGNAILITFLLTIYTNFYTFNALLLNTASYIYQIFALIYSHYVIVF